MSLREAMVLIPQFDGTSPWSVWKNRVTLTLCAKGVKSYADLDEKLIVELLEEKLVGQTKALVESGAKADTLVKLLETLEAYYGGEVQKANTMTTMLAYHQANGQSGEEYFDKKLILIKYLNPSPSEELKARYIRDGLADVFSEKLIGVGKTLEDLRQAVVDIDRLLAKKTPTAEPQISVMQANITCNRCGGRGHYARACASVKSGGGGFNGKCRHLWSIWS